MTSPIEAALAFAVAYAVIGNAVVGLILARRKASISFWRAGLPFYLYGVCNRLTPPTSRALRGFALSTNIAGILAIPLALCVAVADS
jgi:hypothetical protein